MPSCGKTHSQAHKEARATGLETFSHNGRLYNSRNAGETKHEHSMKMAAIRKSASSKASLRSGASSSDRGRCAVFRGRAGDRRGCHSRVGSTCGKQRRCATHDNSSGGSAHKAARMYTGNMSFSNQLINMIKQFEGFSTQAYLDPAGKPTIGFGYTDQVKMGATITEAKATTLLESKLLEASQAVDRLVKVPLNQNQKDALTSFTYNVGQGNLKRSTLLKELNEGGYCKVPAEMCRWDKATNPNTGKKEPLKGLTMRRDLEAKRFAQLDCQGLQVDTRRPVQL